MDFFNDNDYDGNDGNDRVIQIDNNDGILPASTPPIRNRALPEKPLIKKRVIAKSPFTNSKFSETLADRVWYYIDELHKTQGPFTSLEM